ncbi:hypothetical protein F4V43_05985 [Paenibacillus spiritus]|uniref:Uncharacterized protein n=1 Tax=Paenibacillus spiritus TaxID=2496557 RepID=A0A5J5GFL0_9BACL|nr:hypothetical protein [Paenibacillus spiritus]KAA9006493.1 hypothetical protein F4V43_05985 [Paenibacillus spiritus]
MNEGIGVFRELSREQREERLRRSGLAAALEKESAEEGRERQGRELLLQNRASGMYRPRGNAESPPGPGSPQLCCAVRVHDLRPLQYRLTGAGAAMGAASVWRPAALPFPGRSAEAPPGPGERAEQGGETGPLLRRACRTAVRALYALGLDSGEAELAALGGGRFAVLAVRPATAGRDGRLPEPYASAEAALRRALAGEPGGRPGLLMGMDPEFLVLREDTGRVVPASRYLPRDGVAGCDAGPPGTRGLFPVGELRPAAQAAPRALLAQLRSAARLADRLMPDRRLAWRAGGMPLRGWALGGHLHFSGVQLTAPLLRALDNYLALPMALLADSRASGRCPRYGTLGDFRLQPHGGFEYRTLPSFLVSPSVAEGAVHLGHLIVARYEELQLRPLDSERAHRAYYAGDKEPLLAVFPALADDLRRLPGYAAAAEAAEPLFRRIEAGLTWDESEDVRELWRGCDIIDNSMKRHGGEPWQNTRQ